MTKPGDEIIVKGWRLVYAATGFPVLCGAQVTSFRGEVDTVIGGTPPHKPSSTGRVQVNDDFGPTYFPGVYGLKWVEIDNG